MALDSRFISIGILPEVFDDLAQDQRRMILCSRDYARRIYGTSNVLATATPDETKFILGGFPWDSALDGNRESMLVTSPNCEWVEAVIDLKGEDRKALMQLRYPVGGAVELHTLSMSGDARVLTDPDNAVWHEIHQVVSNETVEYLYCGDQYSLIKLPYDDGATAENYVTSGVISAGGVTFSMASGVDKADDFWNGAILVPVSGPNQGQARRILDWVQATKTVTIDRPWLNDQSSGSILGFTKYGASRLNSRFMKVKVRRKYGTSAGPICLIGLSVFNFYSVLKGDLYGLRASAAGNPSDAERTCDQPGGYRHQVWGGSRMEQHNGPKDRIVFSWGAAYAGFHEELKSWSANGSIGIVDELGAYSQGYVESINSRRLPRAIEAENESGFTVVFVED